MDFGDPAGSAPGYRRPAVVVSSDRYNRSRVATVIVVAVTSNLRQADAPGNVLLDRHETGLPKDSVVNVTQLLTIDRSLMAAPVGRLPAGTQRRVDSGLRLVLSLQ